MIQEEPTTANAPRQEPTEQPITPETGRALLRSNALAVLGARQTLSAAQATVRQSRAAWELANAGLIAAVDQAKADLAAKEGQFRELAIAVYQDTGSKSPGPGVGIRVTRTYAYDRDRVKSWCINHKHAALLRLDENAVESVGERLQIPTFEVGTLATATIAENLSAALEAN